MHDRTFMNNQNRAFKQKLIEIFFCNNVVKIVTLLNLFKLLNNLSNKVKANRSAADFSKTIIVLIELYCIH